MPSYLGHYKNAASNRHEKLHRAIQSFINQNVGELIVVSDGCNDSTSIAKSYNSPSIKTFQLPKQPLFSGILRHIGIQLASYDWITYLDSDDEYLDNHLISIINNIDDNVDWMYWDDILGHKYRKCSVQVNKIGTSCIAHKKSLPAIWPNGYAHDWRFIQQLGNNYKKITGPKYKVHHIPGKLDD